jgi:hypothetical protein
MEEWSCTPSPEIGCQGLYIQVHPTKDLQSKSWAVWAPTEIDRLDYQRARRRFALDSRRAE